MALCIAVMGLEALLGAIARQTGVLRQPVGVLTGIAQAVRWLAAAARQAVAALEGLPLRR